MKRPERPRLGAARRLHETLCLRSVRLVPDEAVLASCKNDSTAGPAGPIRKGSAKPAVCSHNAR